jgi:hypothetical protein
VIELSDFKIDDHQRTVTLRADHMTPRAVQRDPSPTSRDRRCT